MSLKFSSGGSSITNRFARSSSTESQLRHPWEIFLSPDEKKFGVEYYSDVYDGYNFDKFNGITGLVKKSDDPNDPGWKTPTEGYIFLWGTVDPETGEITKIEIKNDQEDLQNIARLSFNGDGKQTNFAHVLGYIWNNGTSDSPDWEIRQSAWRDITLLFVAINGQLGKATFEM
jgi:hypothetical protein